MFSLYGQIKIWMWWLLYLEQSYLFLHFYDFIIIVAFPYVVNGWHQVNDLLNIKSLLEYSCPYFLQFVSADLILSVNVLENYLIKSSHDFLWIIWESFWRKNISLYEIHAYRIHVGFWKCVLNLDWSSARIRLKMFSDQNPFNLYCLQVLFEKLCNYIKKKIIIITNCFVFHNVDSLISYRQNFVWW